MKKTLFLLFFSLFIISCEDQDKKDLSQLYLNETIESLVDFNDAKTIGVETVEYPYCLLLEIRDGKNYTFDGIDLTGQKVFFQIDSEFLKTDSLTKQGGGHIDVAAFKNRTGLTAILKKYKAANTVYGVRIEMKTGNLKKQLLAVLEKKYGKGTKNTNTDNGLYWIVKQGHRFIFFAPDYDRLIILNNISLSKTCYWDAVNGSIDFGGCNMDSYTRELLKNTHPKKEAIDKPVVKIDKDWNLNYFVLGKTTEQDFVSSSTNQGFEKMIVIDGGTASTTKVSYNNGDKAFYFYFSAGQGNGKNAKTNLLKGYNLQDFKQVNISFENGLRPGISYKEAIKLFNKDEIKNYEDLKISNYIEIKKSNHTVTLNFGGDYLFSGIYIK